ncbi:MAG: type II toxin-antitoxin system HicA family toxin [Planctomycetota bacterium]
MPSPVRFAVLKKLYLDAGWRLERANGSHHIFKSPRGATESVPVHGKKVLPIYVRKAKKAIQADKDSGERG